MIRESARRPDCKNWYKRFRERDFKNREYFRFKTKLQTQHLLDQNLEKKDSCCTKLMSWSKSKSKSSNKTPSNGNFRRRSKKLTCACNIIIFKKLCSINRNGFHSHSFRLKSTNLFSLPMKLYAKFFLHSTHSRYFP
jgi:hypothetical protein